MEKYVLCYVEEGMCYFTNQELGKQWGDDWDGIPYEHNAGTPYQHHGENIKKVFIVPEDGETHIEEPCDTYYCNSNYSVKEINNKEIPWLKIFYYKDKKKIIEEIFAGIEYNEFLEKLKDIPVEIYTRYN